MSPSKQAHVPFASPTGRCTREETPASRGFFGADDGIRTRDPHLGKVMLYQLSHVRMEH
jgi:hypothetical protein